MDFENLWSCIGKGLRLHSAQKAGFTSDSSNIKPPLVVEIVTVSYCRYLLFKSYFKVV